MLVSVPLVSQPLFQNDVPATVILPVRLIVPAVMAMPFATDNAPAPPNVPPLIASVVIEEVPFKFNVPPEIVVLPVTVAALVTVNTSPLPTTRFSALVSEPATCPVVVTVMLYSPLGRSITTSSAAVGIAQFVQLAATFHAPSPSRDHALRVEGAAAFKLTQVSVALDWAV